MVFQYIFKIIQVVYGQAHTIKVKSFLLKFENEYTLILSNMRLRSSINDMFQNYVPSSSILE